MSRPEAPDDSQLQSLAKELAKNVKSQKDLSDLTSKFVKMTILPRLIFASANTGRRPERWLRLAED